MSKDKFLIVKGKAGMGNRILSALDGILYSQITHRKLIIDWSDYTYSNDRSNTFPDFFTIPGMSNLEDALDAYDIKSVYPTIWKNHLTKSVSEMIDMYETSKIQHKYFSSKYTIDIKRTNYQEDFLVKWSFSGEIYKLRRHFKGEFSNLRFLTDEKILKKLIRENLALNKDIQKQVNLFKEKYFTKHIIGLHVRYTDRKTDLNKYPKRIEKIIKQENKQGKSIIFLATDNKKVESYFWDKYGKNNVITTTKWYPQDSKSLHQNSECPDRLENGIQALVDIYLLSSCDYLIYDENSTFGFVAKLISDIPESKVINISQYSMKKNLRKIIDRFSKWIL